jgi:hypothetical protein
MTVGISGLPRWAEVLDHLDEDPIAEPVEGPRYGVPGLLYPIARLTADEDGKFAHNDNSVIGGPYKDFHID